MIYFRALFWVVALNIYVLGILGSIYGIEFGARDDASIPFIALAGLVTVVAICVVMGNKDPNTPKGYGD